MSHDTGDREAAGTRQSQEGKEVGGIVQGKDEGRGQRRNIVCVNRAWWHGT